MIYEHMLTAQMFNVKHCRTEYTVDVPSVMQCGAQPKHWQGSWHTGLAAWLMLDH